MGRRRAVLVVFVALVFAGCGGRAEVDIATLPGDFSARQTELAGEAATQGALNPTATRTPTLEPTLTSTPLPTATPGSDGGSPVAASSSTTEPIVGPPPTETPEPTPPDVAIAVITGCGSEPLTIQARNESVAAQVEQWRQMGEASQAIFTAWDAFFATFGDFFIYNQVVNNTEVFEAAEAFQIVADEQFPVLRAIAEDSPFYDLAQTVIGTAEDQIAVGQLLTRAGTEHDPAYWDQALSDLGDVQPATGSGFHNRV